MGLNDGEYASILQTLGREPTQTELGMFAVMWSEHCGYKYSRPILSRFRQYREAQAAGALENAGHIALDKDLGIVFKVESHNHPSAVEPFQGAATGVGGILRDIFTMGARPVAILNSLWFGDLDDARSRYLFENVVAGIGHYGNCVGVPTVAGETHFHPCYRSNPLVNAMAVGVVPLRNLAKAAATGTGNPVIYVGSATGRDGIHGATFASTELNEGSESRRPNVQMGDPFLEKLLIEATLEALATGAITGIQDMGAAGLTCSTSEMAARADVGIEIDVRLVPLRDPSMSTYEIMLSESQERMLCVAQRGREREVLSVFERWGLHAAVIGHVTTDGVVRILDAGAIAAEVPAKALTDNCPVYHLEVRERPPIESAPRPVPEPLCAAGENDASGALTCGSALLQLLGSANGASKEWVHTQYDRSVQTQTVELPGSDAAVLALRGSEKGIALSIDGNSRWCRTDPFIGAQLVVAEAARNVACAGARPAGLTNCLNFASPEEPARFWEFRSAVDGIATAAEAFGIPVVSGNVSFYNETAGEPIWPTPVIGMVGILANPDRAVGAAFQRGDNGGQLALVSAFPAGAGPVSCGEYRSVICGDEGGPLPLIDLEAERRLFELLVAGHAEALFASCHDCSSGGLAVALAECCMLGRVGAAVVLRPEPAQTSVAARLFGENSGRVIVSLKNEAGLARLQQLGEAHSIVVEWIGTVGGEVLRVAIGAQTAFDCAVSQMQAVWRRAIPAMMIRAQAPTSASECVGAR
ncbi:MAG: phosphoribosylformylglycinamidine synthase subunit PurL [Armatimonadetes bacterium]|nr:phosphoribosylformylglycinamidine synthase subunit PurL [Armatimonadota bacterium]MDE2206380.1 phosphoribosylformylglycinamidine synthase subunit PurL [Armatimonadota bacterium]